MICLTMFCYFERQIFTTSNDYDGEMPDMIINGLFSLQEKYEVEKRKRQRMSETLHRSRERAIRQKAKFRSHQHISTRKGRGGEGG